VCCSSKPCWFFIHFPPNFSDLIVRDPSTHGFTEVSVIRWIVISFFSLLLGARFMAWFLQDFLRRSFGKLESARLLHQWLGEVSFHLILSVYIQIFGVENFDFCLNLPHMYSHQF
jgi:hypothetical protein